MQIHTPDSSRYWIASTFEDRLAQGLEPENIDKVRGGSPQRTPAHPFRLGDAASVSPPAGILAGASLVVSPQLHSAQQ